MILVVNDGIRDIVITTKGNDNEIVTPSYQPDSPYLKYLLQQSYGYYGHIIDPDSITALDLYTALLLLDTYKVISIDNVPKPDELPEGAVS